MKSLTDVKSLYRVGPSNMGWITVWIPVDEHVDNFRCKESIITFEAFCEVPITRNEINYCDTFVLITIGSYLF